MEFRFEDIIKNIIPGSVLASAILGYYIAPYNYQELDGFLNSHIKDYSEFLILGFLLISYLLGYIIDAISSWGEYYTIYKLFGPPSYTLFKGEGSRINFKQADLVIANLEKEYNLEEAKLSLSNVKQINRSQAGVLFTYANIYSQKNSDEVTKSKMKEYYYSFVFARNIFFSMLISALLLVSAYYQHLHLPEYLIIIAIIILFYIRRKDKSYYYTRQVLIACLKKPAVHEGD